jgi:hypothetical protein
VSATDRYPDGQPAEPQTRRRNKAWHYSDGKWALGDDPVLDALLDAQAGDRPTDVLRKLGHLEIFSVGHLWQAGFELWEREDGSALIMTGMDEDARFFYVAAAPDAREICVRWAALTRDKVIIDVLYDLTGTTTDLDITGDAIGRIKSLLGGLE